MQVYSVVYSVSQSVDGHVAMFALLKLDDQQLTTKLSTIGIEDWQRS